MHTHTRRNLLLSILFLGAAALMVECTTTSDAPAKYQNGLTCQSYTNHFNQGLTVTKGSDCSFKCPDGRLLSLPDAVVSQSKDELNFLFCGAPMPTPSPRPGGPAASASDIVPTPTAAPLLTGEVSSCYLNTSVINFRFVQPPPDLTGKNLSVLIQGQPSQCYVPPGFPGSLSCKLPPNTSFPTGIVVTLDNAVVNSFSYNGVVCQQQAAQNSSQGFLSTSVPATQRPTPKPTNPPPTNPPPTNPPPTNPPPTNPPPTNPPPTQPPPTDPPPTQAPPTVEPPTVEPPTVDPPTFAPPPTHEPPPTRPPRPTRQPRPTRGPRPTKPPSPGIIPPIPGVPPLPLINGFGAYLVAFLACLVILAI